MVERRAYFLSKIREGFVDKGCLKENLTQRRCDIWKCEENDLCILTGWSQQVEYHKEVKWNPGFILEPMILLLTHPT